MPKLKLTYFDFHGGRGEPARLALSIRRHLPIFVATVLDTPLALAGTAQDPLNVFNNMAQETVECAAYFGIVSIGFENSNKPDAAKKYEEVRDTLSSDAAILTEQAGLKAETVGARFNMAVEEMSKRIDMNTSNISVLMNDYRDLCQEVMTDPEKRGRYWTERGAKELKDKLGQPPQ